MLCQWIFLPNANYQRLAQHRMNVQSFRIYRESQQSSVDGSICESLHDLLDVSALRDGSLPLERCPYMFGIPFAIT